MCGGEGAADDRCDDRKTPYSAEARISSIDDVDAHLVMDDAHEDLPYKEL